MQNMQKFILYLIISKNENSDPIETSLKTIIMAQKHYHSS